MIQQLFYLTVIFTVVYSDCCTEYKANEKCTDRNDIQCHVENYGIYCCDKNVTDSITQFATDSNEIVRSNCTLFMMLYTCTTFSYR